MELAEIRPFEPRMAEIDLFTMPDAVGVGAPSVRKVKPYISGHVTDGSSTFTIRVNNADIVIPVDDNGNWKWVQDRDITSLNNCFNYQKTSCDYIEIYLPKTPNLTDMYRFLYATNTEIDNQKSNLKVVVKAIDTTNVTNFESAFKNTRQKDLDFLPRLKTANCTNFYNMVHAQYVKTIDLRSFDMTKSTGNTGSSGISNNFWNSETETLHLGNFLSNAANEGCNPFSGTNLYLKNITAETIRISVNFRVSNQITEESIVSIFQAVASDNITLTFQPTVFAMIEEQLEIEGSPIYEAYWNSDYDFNYASA